MTPRDRSYLQRRRRLLRSWPWVGSALLVILLTLGTWMFLTRPLLANPGFLWRQLAAGGIDPTTLSLLASLVPVLFLGMLGLAGILILFGFAAAANENRILRLLDEAAAPQAPDGDR